jgi:hypothetical protein
VLTYAAEIAETVFLTGDIRSFDHNVVADERIVTLEVAQ